MYDTIRCYCTAYNHAVDIVFLYKVFVWGKECLVLRLFRIILSIYLRYTDKITIFVDMYTLLEGFRRTFCTMSTALKGMLKECNVLKFIGIYEFWGAKGMCLN